MAFYTILFSPCGGTRRIAEILEREWREAKSSCIDLCNPQITERLPHFQKEDICIIAMPSYGGRAPQAALQRLRAMQGNKASIMHQYGAGRPDAQDTQELGAFAQQIRRHLKKDAGCVLHVAGNHPYKSYGGVPLKPSADKQCMQCGQCATQCPVQAIPVEHPEKTDTARCISCMRCLAVCPVHARSLNKLMLAVSVKKLHKACVTRKDNELFL